MTFVHRAFLHILYASIIGHVSSFQSHIKTFEDNPNQEIESQSEDARQGVLICIKNS